MPDAPSGRTSDWLGVCPSKATSWTKEVVGAFGQVYRRQLVASSDALVLNTILHQRLGQQIQVVVLRLDADAGRVLVSERLPGGRQLALPLFPRP